MMNKEDLNEYRKHLSARSIEQLEVLKSWFYKKPSELNREQKIEEISKEIDRKKELSERRIYE